MEIQCEFLQDSMVSRQGREHSRRGSEPLQDSHVSRPWREDSRRGSEKTEDVGMCIVWSLFLIGIIDLSVALFHFCTTSDNPYSQLEFIMMLDGMFKMMPGATIIRFNPENGFPVFFVGFVFSLLFPFSYWSVATQVQAMTEKSVFQLWAMINVYFVTVIVHYALIIVFCSWVMFVLAKVAQKQMK